MSTQSLTITTPELVAIRLWPAGWGSRFGAFLIDLLLIVLLASAAAVLALQWLPTSIGHFVAISAQFVIIWGYHLFFELRWQGQSPGKRLYLLRVVDERGLPLSWPQSLVRNAVRLLDLLPFAGGCGALCMVLDPHRRRLGDLAAGTLVVDERPLQTPPLRADVARRHNSLDTPRIRRLIAHRLDSEQRAFLATSCQRAEALTAEARFACMQAAATYFRQQLALPAEEHLSDENMLRALAAIALRD